VKCWGENTNGELGYGDTILREPNSSLPFVNLPSGDTIVDIKAGVNHTCILSNAGVLRCWGLGNSGQLGHGSTSNIGDQASEMGEALPAVNLGTGLSVVQFATGHQHTCAILSDDSLKCWGRNSDGQLGLGNTSNRGDGPGEMGDSLAAINLGTNLKAIQVSGNYYSTCALLNTNQVKCWGNNTNGVLGQGHTNKIGDGPGEMGDFLPAIDLGVGFTSVGIESGAYHNCALSDLGKVKCWGGAGSGQLANGNSSTTGDAPNEMGENLPYSNLGSAPVTELYLESYQTCFGYADKSIRCNGTLGGQTGGYLSPDSGAYGWSLDLLGDMVPNFWF
jgi:alpha-tubulin suppressor-like RCC1 family protein